jgi:hypothetical protein
MVLAAAAFITIIMGRPALPCPALLSAALIFLPGAIRDVIVYFLRSVASVEHEGSEQLLQSLIVHSTLVASIAFE